MSQSTSTDLVLSDHIKNFEKAAAQLIIYSEKKYGNKSSRQKNQTYQEKMDKAFKLFGRLCEGLGQTEYGVEPYTGEQTLEKYRMAVTDAWSGREEPKDSVKAITGPEIAEATDKYESRKTALQSRRQQLIESETAMKKLYLEDNKDADGEPDVDELVEQALNNKRPKARPALAQSSYQPLFANDGKSMQRHIAPSAASGNHMDDVNDYRGWQKNLLKESDSPPPTKEELASSYEKGVESRRRVMERREANQGQPYVSPYSNSVNVNEEEDDGDEDPIEYERSNTVRRTQPSQQRVSQSARQSNTRFSAYDDTDDVGDMNDGANDIDASDMMMRRSRKT